MLAGYLAASWSKSGNVATYGDLAFPGVTRFMDGFYAGVSTTTSRRAPLSRSSAGTARWRIHDDGHLRRWQWLDRHLEHPARARQFAKFFLDQGVDIVHPVPVRPATAPSRRCSRPGSGRSASTTTSPSPCRTRAAAILTSAQKAIDVSVLDVIKKTSVGDLGGELSGTLANDGVLLSPFHDFDSQISGRDQG